MVWKLYSIVCSLSAVFSILQFAMRAAAFRPVNCFRFGSSHRCTTTPQLFASTTTTPTTPLEGKNNNATTIVSSSSIQQEAQPLLLAEGIFAVDKPLNWTSSDVVSYIRSMLEREARSRGVKHGKVGSRRSKGPVVRVGHGGTLDPLATGVLVIAVGKGTKQLQSYLSGSKSYQASGVLGFETTTLDMEGNITKRADFEHVNVATLEKVVPQFIGTIQQIPPVYSALKKNGKKMYAEARKGKLTSDDATIEPRQVQVHALKLVEADVPNFSIQVDCGGGTYIRSLIRDIAYQVDSVATTTALRRTQQGQFQIESALKREDWSPENVYAEINKVNAERLETPE